MRDVARGNRCWCGVVVAVLLAGVAAANGDPYFEIRSFGDWDEALGTGHVVPLMPPEWDEYMGEWMQFTQEGEPYPETQFIPPTLYPYEGDAELEEPGLVMAWGEEGMPDGQYASAWKYDYLVDPDLSKAVISMVVFPPQFGAAGGGITQISFGIQDVNGNTRSWYWNVGPGQTIPWAVGTPIVIDASQTGLAATTPSADGYMSNPAFDITQAQYFIADENGLLIGGTVPIPPPGGPPAAIWNYWYNVVVQPGFGEIKWEQPPTYNPDSPFPDCFWGWDEFSNYEFAPIMADDFLCQDDRPITDIHWWGSYIGWQELEPPPNAADMFHIGIWTDVAAGDPYNPFPWSHPGVMLWEWWVSRDQLNEQWVGCDFHPWFMPVPESTFRYDFIIPESEWFWQEPGENVYWLSIAPKCEPEDHPWGWLTRQPNWNDAAVRIFMPPAPVPGAVFEQGDPVIVEDQNWDLAFVLTTNEPGPEEEACCLPDGTCVYLPPADCLLQGGFFPPGGVCLGDLDGNGVDDACEEPQSDYLIEFSLDIGSDTELSDPFMDGDEAFDPGDVYWWQSAPVVPPGRDGFKDDQFIFAGDPWPDPPDPTLATRVPVGAGSIQDYWEWFDLDAHDQLDISFAEGGWIPPEMPLEMPIPKFDSLCIHGAAFLAISMDDDMAPGWPAFDVPVTVPSPAGVSSYGATATQDEVIGLTLLAGIMPPPYPLLNVYPIADEVTVHSSLAPNPDGIEEQDDDVDSLDTVLDAEQCPYWYFSADHEAHLGLNPGAIYQVTPLGPVMVISQVHLGIPPETDIDAFEFVWAEDPQFPGMSVLVLLYSVDEDDPLTPWDESGGLPPFVVLGSSLMGYSFEVSEPLWDDIDALTAWVEPYVPEATGACCVGTSCSIETLYSCVAMGGVYQGDGTTCTPNPCITLCAGDLNCDGVVDYGDIDPFVAAIGCIGGDPSCWPPAGVPADCPWLNGDCDGDGDVTYSDIDPFVARIGATCP